MYRWQGHTQFEFGTFLIIALYTSSFYAMSVVLYPRDGSLRDFDSVRTPFFVTALLYALLEVPYYETADFGRPSFYWYTAVPLIVLIVIAMWKRRKALDALVAAFWLMIWGGWWFVAKFTA